MAVSAVALTAAVQQEVRRVSGGQVAGGGGGAGGQQTGLSQAAIRKLETEGWSCPECGKTMFPDRRACVRCGRLRAEGDRGLLKPSLRTTLTEALQGRPRGEAQGNKGGRRRSSGPSATPRWLRPRWGRTGSPLQRSKEAAPRRRLPGRGLWGRPGRGRGPPPAGPPGGARGAGAPRRRRLAPGPRARRDRLGRPLEEPQDGGRSSKRRPPPRRTRSWRRKGRAGRSSRTPCSTRGPA